MHLMEFQFVCSSMIPENADEEILKLKAFPFSLADRVKDWLYKLPNWHIRSWDDLRKAFLEKYFPTSKVISRRKQITGIAQSYNESFSQYYERFQTLLASCPQHQFKDENLLQFFYGGLLPLERQMLDAASGGSFVDKTPVQGLALIANRAANAQQYEDIRHAPQQVNEVSVNSNLVDQISKLTSVLSQVLTPKGVGTTTTCGVCSMQGHMANQCPKIVENQSWENVNAMGYQGGQFQQRNNPFSATYNEGWRNHPNFRWNNNDNVQNAAPTRPPGFFQKPQVPQNSNFNNSSNSFTSNPNYDKMFEAITASTAQSHKMQQDLSKSQQELIRAQQAQGQDIAELKKQVGDILNQMNQSMGHGRLPAGTIPNPSYAQFNAITTRSGKVLGQAVPIQEEQEVVEILKNQVEDDPATSKAENQKAGKTGEFDPLQQGRLPSIIHLSPSQPPVSTKTAAQEAKNVTPTAPPKVSIPQRNSKVENCKAKKV